MKAIQALGIEAEQRNWVVAIARTEEGFVRRPEIAAGVLGKTIRVSDRDETRGSCHKMELPVATIDPVSAQVFVSDLQSAWSGVSTGGRLLIQPLWWQSPGAVGEWDARLRKQVAESLWP